MKKNNYEGALSELLDEYNQVSETKKILKNINEKFKIDEERKLNIKIKNSLFIPGDNLRKKIIKFMDDRDINEYESFHTVTYLIEAYHLLSLIPEDDDFILEGIESREKLENAIKKRNEKAIYERDYTLALKLQKRLEHYSDALEAQESMGAVVDFFDAALIKFESYDMSFETLLTRQSVLYGLKIICLENGEDELSIGSVFKEIASKSEIKKIINNSANAVEFFGYNNQIFNILRNIKYA